MKKTKQFTLILVCVIAAVVIVISAVISRSNTGKPTVDQSQNQSQTFSDETSQNAGSTSSAEQTVESTKSGEEPSQTTASDVGVSDSITQQDDTQSSSTTKKDDIKNGVISDSNEIMAVSSQLKSVCGNAYTSQETGRKVVNADTEYWNLVVVNKTREYDGDYKPNLSPAIPGSDIELDSRVAPYYTAMYNAAKKDGIYLTPFSGYRRYSTQERNYKNLTEEYMTRYNLSRKDAAEKAATVILPPGTSEHNIGLAMDICNVYDSFADTDEYAWLTKHAQDYGFILRYTAEKQSITGIVPEPWHWRFVGIENAKKIKASGLCLEEYLDSLGIEY